MRAICVMATVLGGLAASAAFAAPGDISTVQTGPSWSPADVVEAQFQGIGGARAEVTRRLTLRG